jgi:hypothetical protein
MAIKMEGSSPRTTRRVRPKSRGGPINPPDVHGGPINPPDVHAGPINPPDVHGQPTQPTQAALPWVAAYQANVGVGVFLRALDRVPYIAKVEANRRADRRAIEGSLLRHSQEITRLLALGPAQRNSLCRTGLMNQVRVSKRGATATLTIGQVAWTVTYPKRSARAAVKATRDASIVLPHGAETLWLMAAEAEDPVWAFVHALGMHRGDARRYAWTGEVLRVVNDVVASPIYAIKHLLNVKRPNQVDPTIETWLPTPAHASFPSGHASFAHAAAAVLTTLCGAKDPLGLSQVASEVAKRRELAGLHTDLDSQEGQRLGEALGRYMLKQAQTGAAAELAPWRALFALASREWAA